MNRRRWLQGGVVAGAAAFVPHVFAAAGVSRIIDTHTHFYDPTRPQGVPWPGKGTPLYRKVMPQDWLKVVGVHGIRETVVVEASQWVEDNQWVLDVASTEKSIVGFCGNLDPTDSNYALNLKRFAANPLFRGVRWRADLVRIDAHREKALAGAKLLADHGLQLDLNGPPGLLVHAATLAAAVPDLRIVIDHCGGPGDPKELSREWLDGIRQIGAQKNVFMKVSGLVEQVKGEVGKAPRDTEYYRPILDHLWEMFGEDRLIYGSNWPVSDLGVSYDVVFKIACEYFGEKGPAVAEKYFWKNSQTAYRWIERS